MEFLRQREDLKVLFSDFNMYWNYLSPSLLEHIAKKCNLLSIKKEMDLYKIALQEFRVQTPLKLFCQIEVKYIKPTEEFHNIVVNFQVSVVTTLQDVDDFRRRYASHYNLHDFALRLNSIYKGSFIVSFLVPESIIGFLREDIPEDILREFGVTQLDIAGSCVYSDSTTIVASSTAVPCSVSPSAAIPISSSIIVPPQSKPDLPLSKNREPQTALKTIPTSMSMIAYRMHRSMSDPEMHCRPKPEILVLAQQLTEKVNSEWYSVMNVLCDCYVCAVIAGGTDTIQREGEANS